MYAKFINEDIIEKAPTNKDGIFNYNLNIELMMRDGYKEVIELEKPSEFIKPMQKYRELEDKIERYWIDNYEKPTLDELKIQKRAEINAIRDASEQGGFVYLDRVFDSDQVSCQRISMAAQAMALAPEGATITWTCQDNTTIDLTAQELVGMVAALAHWSNECHIKATALKEQIDLAETEEDLEKIQWNESMLLK